jgi:hypothetical protein
VSGANRREAERIESKRSESKGSGANRRQAERMGSKRSESKVSGANRRLNVTLPVIGAFISIVPGRGKEDWWFLPGVCSLWSAASSSDDSFSVNQIQFSFLITSHFTPTHHLCVSYSQFSEPSHTSTTLFESGSCSHFPLSDHSI